MKTFALALALTLALPLAAHAHPRVVSAEPGVNAATAGSPTTISITFSEPLFIRFCGIVLKDAAGHTIRTGPVALDPANDHRLVAPVLTALAPGGYTVNWRAVSADTHRVQGAYGFTLR